MPKTDMSNARFFDFHFYKLLTLLSILLFCLAGCDFLKVQPKQSIGSEEALTTESDVKKALISAYDGISDAAIYGGRYMVWPDFLADNGDLQYTGTREQPSQIINKSILPSNSQITDGWTEAYDAINITNNVLGSINQIEGEQERARVEGEARLIRAAIYFELVRLFAKPWNAGDPTSNLGVPLVLEPTRTITEENNVTRNTVQEVYEQVISDLSTARNQLPESNGVFADTYVASALLSRVYLMQKKYQDAAEAANRVIQSGQFSLAPTFADAFNNSEDIPEYVFAIQISAQDGINTLNDTYAARQDGGTAAFETNITAQHLDRYVPDDDRESFFYEDSETGNTRTQKFQNAESSGANIPIIRLAEMYLTRAEANLRDGSMIGASPVEDINTIRERAGLSKVNDVEVSDVMRQRRLELSFEGNLLHDLQRTDRSVGSIPFDANRLVYPIPQREIDTNPEIQQNPGY